ncbi:hypothetical protein KUCAC02_003763, partial [Chaenocephalus aceratus]
RQEHNVPRTQSLIRRVTGFSQHCRHWASFETSEVSPMQEHDLFSCVALAQMIRKEAPAPRLTDDNTATLCLCEL